jgi:hypothetical protein
LIRHWGLHTATNTWKRTRMDSEKFIRFTGTKRSTGGSRNIPKHTNKNALTKKSERSCSYSVIKTMGVLRFMSSDQLCENKEGSTGIDLQYHFQCF